MDANYALAPENCLPSESPVETVLPAPHPNLACLRAIPDLILRVSRSGTYLDVVHAEGFASLDLQVIDRHLTEVLPLPLAQQQLQLIEQAFHTGEIQTCEYTLPQTDGPHHYETRIVVCGRDEVLMIVRDITDRKQSETLLQRYQLLVQHLQDLVLFLQPNGQIVEANEAAVTAYGYSRAELLTLRLHDLHLPASLTQVDEQLQQASRQSLLLETIHRRQDDSLFPVEMSLQGARVGEETLLLSVIRDTTNRTRSDDKLFQSAFHDPLTHLPNRSWFMKRLRQAIQLAKQQDYQFAVLFLDLDRFKVVNDSLGHLAGDQLLVAIAQRLSACLEAEATLARFGGDEFTILLENVQEWQQVTQVAERIQQELLQPFPLRGQAIFTSTSIGIVLSTTALDQPDDFLRSADLALYRAKALGGTRYVVFDAEMHSRAMMRLRLETDLRHALVKSSHCSESTVSPSGSCPSQFLVYYQPIVSLKTSDITGFEALVRWQHPDLGLVSPAAFIPIAEETGLIVPIGWLVLREACRQLRTWQQQSGTQAPLTMSVNLSVKQFGQPDLVEQIRQILEETGLSPKSLKLEITESVVIDNAEATTRMMRELQEIGVQLSLDDFGTGYSSLSYLHRLPINTLKIDRSFINRVDSDGEQLEIVRSIITLAWNLGIDVVAEGVETHKQLAQLRALRCEYGQGYLFAKPVPSSEATILITG